MRVTKYNVVLNSDKKTELVKESSANYPQLSRSLSGPSIVRDLAEEVFHASRMAEEYTWLIATDSVLHLTGVFEISHGSDRIAMLGAREIFTRLFLCGAGRFFLVHNHPSGDTTPSKEDIASTKKILKGSQVLGVELMDHIIVGSDRTYYSFQESMPEIFSK